MQAPQVFSINLDEFRYIRKHRINLETRYHLKIILPEVFNQTCTFATVSGEKEYIQELKNFLKEKVGDNSENQSTSTSVPLITLSDSDSEIQNCCETPNKKKRNKITKRKFQSMYCSTPLAMGILTTERNSSEIQELDGAAPDSKRMRSGPAFSTKEYIPLAVTTNTKGARSVKMKRKSKTPLNATNENKSNIFTEDVMPWQPRITVSATTSCINSNSSYVECTPVTSVTSTAANATSPQDDSVRIIEDTFVVDNKPITSYTIATSSAPCKTDLDDSVGIMDDSVRIIDDSVRIIDDSIVLDNEQGLPKENDTSTVELDDSIIEIPINVSENRLTSQSNAVALLNQIGTNPLTNRNSTITSSSQNLAMVFNKDNFIPLHNRTVRLRKRPNGSQKRTAANVNLINGGSQNSAARFSFLMPDDLAPQPTQPPQPICLQVPRPMTVKLRPVVIDGSNVARAHGRATSTFSCRGIKISVDYFLKRGHTEVTVFIPSFRKHHLNGKIPTTDANILEELEKTRNIAYSPSRIVDGKARNCYDDRFVVQLATETGGVIVSNDNFRDIMEESEAFKKTIKERLLMFCFASDIIMFPDDPLGKEGPRLKEFLAFPPVQI